MTKITTKAFWITSGNTGARFLNFLATIYLARVLGTANFGLVSIGLSVLGYAVWISDMGLVKIGTRETAKPLKQREFTPSALFWIRFGAGILVFIGGLALVNVLPLEGNRPQVIGLFLISVIPQSLFLDWYFTGLQKYREVAIGKIAKSACFFLLVYLVIDMSQDVGWVPIFYLAGSLAATTYLFIRLQKPGTIFRFTLIRETAIAAIRKSLTIGLGSSFNQVVQLLPPIVIGAFISASDAGIYSAAFKIILIGSLLDQVFVNLFLPMFTSYWSHHPDRAPAIISRIFRIMLLLGLIFSAAFMTASDWIIPLLFGVEYTASIPLLKILSWFLAATFANSVFAFGLLAINQDQGYFRSMLRGGIFSAFLITGLTLIGAPFWTALAVLISEMFIMSSNYIEIRSTLTIDILQPALAGLACIIISAALYIFTELSLLLQLPLITGIIPLMYYIMGGIKYSDITWLIRLIKR